MAAESNVKSVGAIEVQCSISDHVNVAFYQNAIPIIRDLALVNGLERDVADVSIGISSRPPFLTPGILKIDRIAQGGVHHVPTLDVKLDHTFISDLTASSRAEVLFEVLVAGEPSTSVVTKEIHLLPPAHWGGSASTPELLAAFVRPTDASVDVVLRDAAEKLAQSRRDTSFDGYRSGKKARVWEMAEAIWAAMVGYAITYVLPPVSFEKSGQLVRGPSEILERKVGTCLDLALMYAACLEQAGLNAVLVLTDGHALVGTWLVDEEFASVTVDDPQMLRKRVQLDEMVLVESTGLTGASPARFKQAVEAGAAQIAEEQEGNFEIAVDIRRARRHQIRPLDLGGTSKPTIAPTTVAGASQGLGEIPSFSEDVSSAAVMEEPADRLELWKRRLLDLSLRNKLLNFKDGKTALSIECNDVAALEDILAQGKGFKLSARATVLREGDQRDAVLFAERQKDDGRKLYIDEALRRGELHAHATDTDLETRLTELFRASRTAFEEGGSNTLFLCVGFLKWSPSGKDATYKAPLLLIPVRLERKSVRSGFRLFLHEDEVRFNPTLLQMLRQDYRLPMPELRAPLPTDESGVDVRRILRVVKDNVKETQGWEVTDQVVLSTLSFTKYLMWKDLVDRTDTLKRNAVVRHLIDTPKHSYAGNADFVPPSEIDRVIDPIDIFTPLSSDSSQLSAVVAAARGKDFVLFGPPGTGKSQTITNMITTCLAHGKTVLFVSQKTAALEVVQRRLAQAGLGNYCLEVHSAKAQRSTVVGQLGIAWRARQSATEEDWAAANSELRARRDELNRLVSALHRRRQNGMSAFEAFSRVVADRDRYPEVPLGWDRSTRHSSEDLAQLRALCGDIRTALIAIGSSHDHPLQGLNQARWTPAWRDDFLVAVDKFQTALTNFQAKAAAFGESIGIGADSWESADIVNLTMLGAHLLHPHASDAAHLIGIEREALVNALSTISKLVEKATAVRNGLSSPFDVRVVRLNLAEVERDWADAANSNFLLRSGRKERVRQRLKPYCKSEIPDDIGADLVLLRDLAAINDQLIVIEPLGSRFACWQGLDTDIAHLDEVRAWAEKANRLIAAFSENTVDLDAMCNHVATLLTSHSQLFADGGVARLTFSGVREAWTQTRTAAEALAELAGLEGAKSLLQVGPYWIDQAVALMNRWKMGLVQAPAWCRWRAAVQQATRSGLSSLVEKVDAGQINGDELAPVFDYAYAIWWSERVVDEDETLSSFLVEEHESRIEAFARADTRVAELSRRIVRSRISGGVPKVTEFGNDPEWGTLAREIARSRMPLRQLFTVIPTALAKLAPCMMMSPLSIAQYLPADAQPFDVVIFDEASQIPVWDAVGAMARGKQVVIVGDPEQLPPTNVGDRNAEEDDETLADLPSVLDECLGANIPRIALSWHYRSRHESLIAFSNAKYYHGNLVTFPSPVTQDTAVNYVHVPDGIYERGSGRVNRKEATTLVADVVRRLKSSPSSIGVVTFNGEQQRLIENLLDQQRLADPSLEPFFDPTKSQEPVFIKNLENVQGDERDVILFSVAVGPDTAGVVRAQISSLNRDGGHRRLNVAVTRARRELSVFATLKPSQIDLGRTNSRGVRDFKHFLEFAERGPRAIAEAFEQTGRETESPFEDAVMRALAAKGWEVHPQIGVSFFRIDLGVVHPDEPGRYLAGIECDGAAYHSSATARDRDRLREIVLTDLGWTIRRIWSTDWWMNPHLALERIHKRLEADLMEDRARAASKESDKEKASAPYTDDSRNSSHQSIRELEIEDTPGLTNGDHGLVTAQATFEIRPTSNSGTAGNVYARGPDHQLRSSGEAIYRAADVTDVARPDRDRFYDPEYRSVVRAMIDHAVGLEGPVFLDVVIARVTKAHGFVRAKDLIRGVITKSVGGRFPTTEEDGRIILWPRAWLPQKVVPWRGVGDRDHADIPMVELASLAQHFANDGADDEEVVRSMQTHLQLGRLRTPTRERFERAIKLIREVGNARAGLEAVH